MRGPKQQFLLVFCAASLAGLAAGYPELFIESGFADGCTSQPAKALGRHPTPVLDTATSITLSQKGSRAPVTAVCPGVAYDLVVDYGGARRRALVTASAGKFATSGSLAADAACPNRAASGSGSATYTNTLTLPCDAKGPKLSLDVSSAAGSSDNFHKATASFTVNPVSKCPDSTCPGVPGAAAAAAPAAAAPDAPAAAATRGVGTTAAEPAAAPAAGAAAVRGGSSGSGSGSSCGASSYQYACAVDADSGAKLHYTLSDSPTPPENACTATAAAAAAAASSSSSSGQQYLHMLLESPASGYSGVGFPQAAGKMFPADSVIGYVDGATGQPVVSAYHLTDYSPTKSAQNSNGLGWASNLGAAKQPGSNGASLLCFSRPVDAPAAAVAKKLDTSAVELNWVGSSSTSFDNPHDLTHSLTLNAADGTAVSSSSSSKLAKQLAHGALMLLAFAVFMPLGTLMARHKWVMGDKEKGGIHPRWFHLHRAIQSLAVVLALAGFILALASFTVPWANMSDPGSTPHSLYNPHRVLGVVAMGLTLLQVVGGLIRPDLKHKRRLNWRKGHQVMGWLALAAGIAVVFMGAVLMHDMAGAPWVNWLLPICLFLGLMLAAGAVGEVWKHKLQRQGAYCPKSHSFGQLPSGNSSSSNGLSSSRDASADALVKAGGGQ